MKFDAKTDGFKHSRRTANSKKVQKDSPSISTSNAFAALLAENMEISHSAKADDVKPASGKVIPISDT